MSPSGASHAPASVEGSGGHAGPPPLPLPVFPVVPPPAPAPPDAPVPADDPAASSVASTELPHAAASRTIAAAQLVEKEGVRMLPPTRRKHRTWVGTEPKPDRATSVRRRG